MHFYIDPGTGSMLFTILVGILGAAIYSMRNITMKLRFVLSGGKAEKTNSNTIPFAVFTDSKRYWNVFEPICDEFEKRGLDMVYYTASEDDPALSKNYTHVKREFAGEGNKAFAKLNMLNATILLSSTPGLDVYQWKRSRDVKYYVHIPHAVSDLSGYRMFGLDYYDAVLLTGDYQYHQIRDLEKLRNLPEKELLTVGMTYMDTLKKRLESAPALEKHPITVLLAPSWGINSIFNRYGDKIFNELLKTGYNIIVRPHPQSYVSEKELIESLMKKFPDSERIQWNRDNDNFDVLRKSDIIISDFSGVIFDFSLVFDKPVIYADTSFDKSPYDSCWLDEELWTFQILPFIGQQLTADNLENIKDIIDTCLSNTKYKQGRDKARSESWACIGESAVKVVDYLENKYKDLTAEIND